ncbi:MAG: hypothetical protein ACKVPY_03705 [Paracoccaceae bacterium]
MLRLSGCTALFLALAAGPALAAQQCAQREQVLKVLADRYGETRRSVGVAPNAAIMEIFASDSTGTWTITVTTPNGMTCLVASGENFEAVAEAPAKPGEKA